MPQLSREIVKRRAARLRAAGEAALARYLARQVGTTAAVLVEGARLGRTEQYARVALDAPAAAGTLVRAAITGATPRTLVGHCVDQAAA